MPSNQYNDLYSKEKSAFGDKPHGFVSKIPELLKSGKIIDIGAGQGRNSFYLAEQGFEVTALDNSEIALETIRSKNKGSISLVFLDLNIDIPRNIEHYDVVVISNVLHHLSKERAREVLKEIKEKSKPGCIHVIANITSEGDFYNLPKAQSRFYQAPGELKEIYTDWEIVYYNEMISGARQRKEDGTPMQNLTAFILAKKP